MKATKENIDILKKLGFETGNDLKIWQHVTTGHLINIHHYESFNDLMTEIINYYLIYNAQ